MIEEKKLTSIKRNGIRSCEQTMKKKLKFFFLSPCVPPFCTSYFQHYTRVLHSILHIHRQQPYENATLCFYSATMVCVYSRLLLLFSLLLSAFNFFLLHPQILSSLSLRMSPFSCSPFHSVHLFNWKALIFQQHTYLFCLIIIIGLLEIFVGTA